MRLWLETENGGAPSALPGDGVGLCAFCSFAVSRGFGATHPLIALADRLHNDHGVRMGPLTTFYDADVQDAEDLEKLDRAWQEASGLRDAMAQLVAALRSDEQAAALARRGGATELESEAVAMVAQLDEPARAGQRVRMVYAL